MVVICVLAVVLSADIAAEGLDGTVIPFRVLLP